MANGLRDPDTLEAIEQPDTPTGDDTTPPGAINQEEINAAIAAAMQEAGIGPDFNFSDVLTAADAEELFKNQFETTSAGLYSEKPVTKEQMVWADIVAVMAEDQRHELGNRFPKLYMEKRILNLDIPDLYYYDQLELKEILKERVEKVILATH